MHSFALGVQYAGTHYSGFQRQEHTRTIQSELEQALSQIADEPIRVDSAGRTDAGVHATQQVTSFSTTSERSVGAWVRGTNSHLPHDIRVTWAKQVNADFHARFSALWRRYCFVYGRDGVGQVFEKDHAVWVSEPLDVDEMSKAANEFLGEQDFSSVRASRCSSKSPMRHVYLLNVFSVGEFVVIDIVANAFLLHMVRNIATVLRAVGSHQLNAMAVKCLLQKRDRKFAPATEKAHGLYLIDVGYDGEYETLTTNTVPSIVRSGARFFQPVNLPANYYRRATHQ